MERPGGTMQWKPVLLALALGAGTLAVQAQDADCAMCHDAAPVPDSHMPVDEVSVESCTMCHEVAGGDSFFRAVHEKHGDALGCDSCHSDASAERKGRLQEMMAQ